MAIIKNRFRTKRAAKAFYGIRGFSKSNHNWVSGMKFLQNFRNGLFRVGRKAYAVDVVKTNY